MLTASLLAASASVLAPGRLAGATSQAPAPAPTMAGATSAGRAPAGSDPASPALVFDPRNFDHPTTIDNPWLPLKPGTQFHFSGSDNNDDGVRLSHDTIFTVTDLTKVVAGVRAVVAWDQDFSDGELVESELVVFAQDNEGNVWHLGQYAEIYEGEDLVGGQAWFQGALRGAKAGIMIPAHPRPGTPAYSEGFAPAPYFWDDFGRVAKVGLKTCVPVRCYDDVMVIEEFEPAKPNAFQLKYLARGVGYVRVGWRGSAEDSQEVLVLAQDQAPRRRRHGRCASRGTQARKPRLGLHPHRTPGVGRDQGLRGCRGCRAAGAARPRRGGEPRVWAPGRAPCPASRAT